MDTDLDPFFIVGAPRCGTTAMSRYLGKHPNICFSDPKETHYFLFADQTKSSDDLRREFLNAYFPHLSDEALMIGEGSISSLYSKDALQLILRTFRAPKFIVMLRNPVDLVYSWHAQLYYSFLEDIGDFSAAWQAQEQRARGELIPERCPIPFALQYREIGSLGKYVEKLLEDAPREQIKIIFMEDFHKDADAVYRECLDYLDVPYEPRRDPRKLNANKRHRFRWLGKLLAHDTRSRGSRLLNKFFKMPVVNKFQVKYWLHEFNKIEYKRPPLNPEIRSMLIEEFRDDIAKLAKVTGRNLDHWLQ